jgi:hypothetical protein
MVNAHKGDVALEVGGKTYTLRYSHSALIKLEKQLDQSIMRIMQDIGKADEMRIGTLVAILWAGLQKHHPDLSVDEACELLDEKGDDASVIDVIGDAFQKAFNAPGTKGTNPQQKDVNGTGMNSSSNTSASVTILTPSGTSRPEN